MSAETFAILWFASAGLMLVHIVGVLGFGWEYDGPVWWAALGALLALAAVNVADYTYKRWCM